MSEVQGTAIGFLFPGQGSQFVGMGREAHDTYPEAREAFAEADAALGMSISQLCFAGDEDELRRTENTQPAILTVSVALQRVLAARGIEPAVVAGHSLGEYSALVAAGSLSLADAVRLVRQRGRFMQEAVPEGQGAMAAILGLDEAAVRDVCERAAAGAEGVVEPANYNSPGQVVVAGATATVDEAVRLASEAGARRAMLLNVSAPFHCSLMQPAADRLAAELAAAPFADAAVPVVCNVDAAPVRTATEIVDALRRQVTSAVRWVESMQAMNGAGVTRFVEIGPGKVLTGLAKRTARGVPCHPVGGPEDVEALAAAL